MRFNYPGFVRGSVFLAVILVVVTAFFSESRAQLTRLDTLLAKAIRDTTHATYASGLTIVGDTQLSPLLALIAERTVQASPTLLLTDIGGAVRANDTGSQMTISMSGHVLPNGGALSQPLNWNFTRPVALTSRDRADLETNRSRYVHLERETPKTFWESTLEPAVVVVGAAAIVALFFLIRS